MWGHKAQNVHKGPTNSDQIKAQGFPSALSFITAPCPRWAAHCPRHRLLSGTQRRAWTEKSDSVPGISQEGSPSSPILNQRAFALQWSPLCAQFAVKRIFEINITEAYVLWKWHLLSACWQTASGVGRVEGEYKAEDVNSELCRRTVVMVNLGIVASNCKLLEIVKTLIAIDRRIPRIEVNKSIPVPLYATVTVRGDTKS